jgi:hypothetical protein
MSLSQASPGHLNRPEGAGRYIPGLWHGLLCFLKASHKSIAGLAFAGFVEADAAVLPFLGASLVGESNLGFHRQRDVVPGA